MSTAFVFPGQGSQRSGMGRDLFDQFTELTATADALLGYSVRRLCVDDPDGNLGRTEFTQPALFIVNALSYFRFTRESGEPPAFVAGHSLGEYNALLAGGVFDFETGLKLVKKRGEIMSRIENGGMAAVIGLDPDRIESIIRDSTFTGVDVANYNSPTQTVISGPQDDVVGITPALESAGARLVIQLKVSGAFHSRYMSDAASDFRAFAASVTFKPPATDVIANVTASPYTAETALDTLARQINHPVRWTDSVQYMLDNGVTDFHEIGPGNVLTGLIRQIKR